MAQIKSTKVHEYDSIVIGSGLSGLIIAHQLEETGRKVALIEAQENVGGTHKCQNTPFGVIGQGLCFYPKTELSESVLPWLKKILNDTLDFQEEEVPPLTFDNGRFEPFVSYGDPTPESAAELNFFTPSHRYKLSSEPHDWVQWLKQSFTGDLLTLSHVTKMQVDDSFVIEIIINGNKRISAREYIFCANPRQLTRLLPETHVPTRLKQKLAKGHYWTSLNLDLVHGHKVSDTSAVHLLRGGQDEPCVGVFHPSQTIDGAELQRSQWTTFVPSTQTDDNETTAALLKKIKRQIKRAYETALDSIKFEKIVVNPDSHGEVGAPLAAELKWPKLDNLWVTSGFFASERNLWGQLAQCQIVLSSIIGIQPSELASAELTNHTTEEASEISAH